MTGIQWEPETSSGSKAHNMGFTTSI